MTNGSIETVAVKTDEVDRMLINKCDFDPEIHTLLKDPEEAVETGDEKTESDSESDKKDEPGTTGESVIGADAAAEPDSAVESEAQSGGEADTKPEAAGEAGGVARNKSG